MKLNIAGALLGIQAVSAFAPSTTRSTLPFSGFQKHQNTFVSVASSEVVNEVNGANEDDAKTESNRISQRAQSVESFKVMDVLCRANELQAQGRTIYHCEVGQPESGAPETVAKAALDALTGPPRKVMGYTDAFGMMELRANISKHYMDKYKTVPEDRVDVKNIVVTTGSSGGFLLTFTACFDTGDTIAVASSGYPCYRNILSALGCNLASIPINDQFKLTAKELTEEIARRKQANETPLKGLILSSPSNPTGAMLQPEELKELCELCDAEGIQFISDEIYHGISYGSVPEATALQYSDKVIVINSFSKYYSMSGWRLGWMVLPPGLVEPINSLQQNMFISAPGISQTAALKCWDEETLEELEQHVDKYRKSREIILDELSTMFQTKQIAPADGGFYIYVNLGDEEVCLVEEHNGKKMTKMGTVRFCQDFLEEEGVAITPGVDFEDPAGDLGERRLRISYAGGIETAKQAMIRFHRFWPKWIERVEEARKDCGL